MTPQDNNTFPKLGFDDDVIDDKLAKPLVPRREFGAHKWGVGGLVVVAGSPGFAGAAALCAMAASRAGAGIVNAAVPHGLAGILTALVPEAALVLLPSGDSTGSGRRAVELIEEKLTRSAALALGPGLGQDETARSLLSAIFGVRRSRTSIGFDTAETSSSATTVGLLGRVEKPLVVDADALNWLADQDAWWDRIPAQAMVLTPHVGEMSRLLDLTTEEVMNDPLGTVREAANRWHQVVVLKYGHTAVSDGKRTLVAGDAPVSLATAGTGDVLTGMIGAFLAQGLSPIDASALAVHVGTRAARRVEERTGVLGLMASDLPLAIAAELAALSEAEETDHD